MIGAHRAVMYCEMTQEDFHCYTYTHNEEVNAMLIKNNGMATKYKLISRFS